VTVAYLADACALIVFLADPDADRVMPNAARHMRADEVRISPITVWEITRKAAIGKLPSVWAPYPSLGRLLHAQGFVIQPLTWDDAEDANRLPPYHKDPMDRMLIATALRYDLPILTDDAVFSAYGVTTIW